MKETTLLLCILFLRLFVVQADEHDHHVSNCRIGPRIVCRCTVIGIDAGVKLKNKIQLGAENRK